VSAIVDRAYKNELTAQLFPFRVRDKLSRIVRNGGRTSINHLVMINERESDDVPSRASSFDKAEQIRNKFYELNDISIVNHTLPDYNTCLSRQATTGAASLIVTMLAPSVLQKELTTTVSMMELTHIELLPGRRLNLHTPLHLSHLSQ
jgi:plasmid replication initiation protein